MPHDPAHHSAHPAVTNTGTRQKVNFPPLLKRNTLASMRMHLQGLGEIQQALAEEHFDEAAQIATMKLGMSSMHGNQMAEETKYMPSDMKQLGAQVHHHAGEFAVAVQNAAVTSDARKPCCCCRRSRKPALSAMRRISFNESCYRKRIALNTGLRPLPNSGTEGAGIFAIHHGIERLL